MRVDFYILPSDSARERALFACRLAEKAYQQGHQLFLRVSDAAEAARLDELLWTFRQGSFLPHARMEAAEGEPILIGTEVGERTPRDVLVNLAESLPAHWSDHERVAEVVNQAPAVLQGSRARYRAYREHGSEPHTHRMDQHGS